MKKGLIIMTSMLVTACSTSTENDVKTEEVIEVAVETLPKVELKVVTLSQEENRDERFGTESSSEVILLIDGNQIDSYFEYGDDQLVDSTLFLSSEMSDKSYTYHVEKNSVKIVFVKYGSTEFMEFDEEGDPIPMAEWESIYKKDKSGEWRMVECKGDCE